MSRQKFSFKVNINYDIALLSEVESMNPYSHRIQSPIWDEIANKLQNSNLKMKVSGRSCKERAKLLIEGYQKDETLSCKLSGVEEEELGSFKLLLTNVIKLYSDKSCQLSKLYAKEDRAIAEAVREQALQDISIEYVSGDGEEDEDSEIPTAENTSKGEPSKGGSSKSSKGESSMSYEDGGILKDPPPKRIRKGDVVSFLQKKHENELEFQREELKLRFLEAKNKKFELEIAREKMALEAKLKEEDLALQKEKMKAEQEEKRLLTQALIQSLNRNS